MSLLKSLFIYRPFIPGVVFLAINSFHSYSFFHVNSAKMVAVALGVTLLFLLDDLLFPVKAPPAKKIIFFGLLALLPGLGTFPGLIYHEWAFNYNFAYEFSTDLMMALWVIYLFSRLQNRKEMEIFFLWIALTMIYVFVWAVAEYFGVNSFGPANQWQRVRSTYGNANYFSGSLIVIAPLLLAVAVPLKFSSLQNVFSQISKPPNTLFLVGFLSTIGSLALAQTRSAIIAVILALGLMGLGILLLTFKEQRRKIFIAATAVVSLGLLLILFIAIYRPEPIIASRFGSVFTFSAWVERILPWEAAFSSFLASPFIGYGLGSSYNLFFSFVDSTSVLQANSRSYNHVHSEWLEILQEGGIVGVFAYLLLLGYLFKNMFRLLLSQTADMFDRRLSLAVMTGILAFFIHGIFSVAQRMMVVNLTFYTIIALGFILVYRYGKPAPEQKKRSRYRFLFVGTLLVALFFLYGPWAYKQWKFIKINEKSTGMTRIQNLEEHLEQFPDIYALDELLSGQIQTRRFQQAEKTIVQIENQIRHYRNVGHDKTFVYAQQGKLKEALAASKEYKTRNQYDLSHLELMMQIALSQNNLDLFIEQYKSLLRFDLYRSGIDKKIDERQIEISITPEEESIHFFYQTGETFRLRLNQQSFGELFTLLKNRQNNTHRINAILSEYGQQLSQNSFFLLNPKPDLDTEKIPKVQLTINEYIEWYSSKEQYLRQMQAREQNEMNKTSNQSQQQTVRNKYIQARQQLNDHFNKNMTEAKLTFLRETTDLSTFQIRNEFKIKLLRRMVI